MSLLKILSCLSQDAIDVPVKLYFRYISEKDAVVFSYGSNCYLYKSNEFRRAFEQALNAQKEIVRQRTPYDRGASLSEAVKKIIHINLNGDGK